MQLGLCFAIYLAILLGVCDSSNVESNHQKLLISNRKQIGHKVNILLWEIVHGLSQETSFAHDIRSNS